MPEPTTARPPKPMNVRQARAEAQRRWGIRGYATHNRLHKSPDGKGKRNVGVWSSDWQYKISYGWADTWEQAFEDATKRGHG